MSYINCVGDLHSKTVVPGCFEMTLGLSPKLCQAIYQELERRIHPLEEVNLERHMNKEKGMVTDYDVNDSNIGFIGLGKARVSVLAPPLNNYVLSAPGKRARVATVLSGLTDAREDVAVMPRSVMLERSSTDDVARRCARRSLLAMTTRLEPCWCNASLRNLKLLKRCLTT